MNEVITQFINRLTNRINNLFARGVLTKIDNGMKVPKAKVTALANETLDGLEFAQDWGFVSAPPQDGTTEVILAFMKGRRDQGIVLKSQNRKFPETRLTLAAGECALYNKVTDTYVHLKADGSITIKSADSITIDAPVVNVTGDIQDKSGTSTTSLRELKELYNQHTHPTPAGESGAPDAAFLADL